MRLFSVLLASLFLSGVVAAQAPARGAVAASFKQQPAGTLLQVMRGILYPNSNIIFNVQQEAPKEIPRQLYTGWQAVENSSIALAEAANLIVVPGRMCSNGKLAPVQRADWIKFTRDLRDAALATYKVAQTKNQEIVADSTDRLSEACEACHSVYRDKKASNTPAGYPDPANRCLP
jgi:hypothetical protein